MLTTFVTQGEIMWFIIFAAVVLVAIGIALWASDKAKTGDTPIVIGGICFASAALLIIGMLFTFSLQQNDACNKAGGTMVRGVCIDSKSVIEIKR